MAPLIFLLFPTPTPETSSWGFLSLSNFPSPIIPPPYQNLNQSRLYPLRSSWTLRNGHIPGTVLHRPPGSLISRIIILVRTSVGQSFTPPTSLLLGNTGPLIFHTITALVAAVREDLHSHSNQHFITFRVTIPRHHPIRTAECARNS